MHMCMHVSGLEQNLGNEKVYIHVNVPAADGHIRWSG